MSVPFKASEVLNFALLQSAAECYLDGVNDRETLGKILKEGANKAHLQGKSPSDSILSSATRFTGRQIDWFTRNYEIVTHYPNDNTGFSARCFATRKAENTPCLSVQPNFSPETKEATMSVMARALPMATSATEVLRWPNCQS